jgi:hypothetical protein
MLRPESEGIYRLEIPTTKNTCTSCDREEQAIISVVLETCANYRILARQAVLSGNFLPQLLHAAGTGEVAHFRIAYLTNLGS